MALAYHSGLIVLEDGWPVGAFTQADALAAREAPPDDRVDHWMDTRIVMLPLAVPAFRAAERVASTRARRLLVVDGGGVRGGDHRHRLRPLGDRAPVSVGNGVAAAGDLDAGVLQGSRSRFLATTVNVHNL